MRVPTPQCLAFYLGIITIFIPGQYRPICVASFSPPVNSMILGNPRTFCLEGERRKEDNPPIMIERGEFIFRFDGNPENLGWS
jgi:hypothetical protein